MAAGSAGDGAAPVIGGPDDIGTLRATIDNMSDSITTHQNHMAELLEDTDRFYTRTVERDQR